ncbi:hypothetical protein AB0L10_40620 [Streptomyces flaveolus]|uniref:hypothetical protein n=1 Tax=Streptomyces flaveolus TaxID=67297 RepID=UPI0034454109
MAARAAGGRRTSTGGGKAVHGVRVGGETCTAPMNLLLTIDSSEWDGGSRSRQPLEDRSARRSATPTEVDVGRWAELNVFACPRIRGTRTAGASGSDPAFWRARPLSGAGRC